MECRVDTSPRVPRGTAQACWPSLRATELDGRGCAVNPRHPHRLWPELLGRPPQSCSQVAATGPVTFSTRGAGTCATSRPHPAPGRVLLTRPARGGDAQPRSQPEDDRSTGRHPIAVPGSLLAFRPRPAPPSAGCRRLGGEDGNGDGDDGRDGSHHVPLARGVNARRRRSNAASRRPGDPATRLDDVAATRRHVDATSRHVDVTSRHGDATSRHVTETPRHGDATSRRCDVAVMR